MSQSRMDAFSDPFLRATTSFSFHLFITSARSLFVIDWVAITYGHIPNLSLYLSLSHFQPVTPFQTSSHFKFGHNPFVRNNVASPFTFLHAAKHIDNTHPHTHAQTEYVHSTYTAWRCFRIANIFTLPAWTVSYQFMWMLQNSYFEHLHRTFFFIYM